MLGEVGLQKLWVGLSWIMENGPMSMSTLANYTSIVFQHESLVRALKDWSKLNVSLFSVALPGPDHVTGAELQTAGLIRKPVLVATATAVDERLAFVGGRVVMPACDGCTARAWYRSQVAHS